VVFNFSSEKLLCMLMSGMEMNKMQSKLVKTKCKFCNNEDNSKPSYGDKSNLTKMELSHPYNVVESKQLVGEKKSKS